MQIHIKIFFNLIIILSTFSLSAQDSISTKPRKNIVSYNYSYSIATVWNQSFAYERAINDQLSFRLMFVIGIPAFQSDKFTESQRACFRVTPELRYYFTNKTNQPLMSGFYSGLFLYYQYQTIVNSNYYDNSSSPAVKIDNAQWEYNYWGGGLSIGYQIPVLKSKRLIFDFNTGLQYSNISYSTNTNDNGKNSSNFTYSRFLSSNFKSFDNNKYNSIDPRIWLSIGYSF